MSKRTASSDIERTPKRIRTDQDSSVSTSASRVDRRLSSTRRRATEPKNLYIGTEADEGDEDEDKDKDVDSQSVRLPNVTRLPESSPKAGLAAAIDNITMRYDENKPSSSQGFHCPQPEKVVSSSSASITDPSSLPCIDQAAGNHQSSVDPGSSTPEPSSKFKPLAGNTEDIQDSIVTRADKLREIGALPWLMNKEFASVFTTHHAVFKVSPRFMGGRLHNRCVSTACPDPFLGANGPAPEGYVAAFCTSNSRGAALKHYHIPAGDLSPAAPRRKNQQCLILDGCHRGHLKHIAKYRTRNNTVEIAITPSTSLTLRFDQICVVNQARIV